MWHSVQGIDSLTSPNRPFICACSLSMQVMPENRELIYRDGLLVSRFSLSNLDITPRQTEVLRKIDEFQDAHNRKPTRRDLANLLGRSESSVLSSIRSLVKKNILEPGENLYGLMANRHDCTDSHVKPRLGEDESLRLANDLWEPANSPSRLPELYFSFILNELMQRTLPDQLELVTLPIKCGKIDGLGFDIDDFHGIEELWDFLSQQIEIVSSFRLDGDSIVLSDVNRRRKGTYETPPVLADALAEILLSHFTTLQEDLSGQETGKDRQAKLKSFLNISLLDPACGSGRLLFALLKKLETYVMESLQDDAESIDVLALRKHLIGNCIFGVDLNPIAVKATRFLLWYYSLDEEGGAIPDIRIGNSLTGRAFGVKDSKCSPPGILDVEGSFDWDSEYPDFKGFDIIITNPPWEKLKMIIRESLRNRVQWTAPTRAEIDKTLEKQENGSLRREIEEQMEDSRKLSAFFRRSGYYPLSSKGDMNLYALFTERCNSLLSPTGVAGLIVPTGIATDYSLRNLFSSFVADNKLIEIHDFLNKKKYFPNVDGRYRYSFFVFSLRSTYPSIKLSFYNLEPNDRFRSSFELDYARIRILNPLTRTLIVPKRKVNLPLLIRLHEEMPILKGKKESTDSWRIEFKRQADMTNDSNLFCPTRRMKDDPNRPGILKRNGESFYRVYEGKMVDQFNHRAGSTIEKTGAYRRSGLTIRPTQAQLEDPGFLVTARYAISESDLITNSRLQGNTRRWHLAYKDITAATNRRTVRAAMLPQCVVTNKLPTLTVENGVKEEACLLGVLNSMAFDFICRQKIGNITLNWFILRQIPIPPLRYFLEGSVDGEPIVDWLTARVAKLTYTSLDLTSWGTEVAEMKLPHLWNDNERNEIQCEIDSLMFHLYRLSPEEIRIVFDEFPHEDRKLVSDIHSAMNVNIP